MQVQTSAPTAFNWAQRGVVDPRDELMDSTAFDLTSVLRIADPTLHEGLRLLSRLILDGCAIGSRSGPLSLPFLDPETINVRAEWFELEDALRAPSALLMERVSAPSEELTIGGAQAATEVIDGVVQRLGLSLKVVLDSAAVKPRTYHHWINLPDTAPRLASVGRLWALLHCVEDLELIVPAPQLKLWIADRRALKLLRAGKFGDLVELAMAEHRPPRVPFERPVIGPDVAGTEVDELSPHDPELDTPIAVRPVRRV